MNRSVSLFSLEVLITLSSALLVVPMLAVAQSQPSKPPTLSGTVVGAALDSTAFSIVDKAGSITTVSVTGGTSYQFSKADVGFSDAIKFGMDVRCTAAPDGSAAQVVARGFATQLNIRQLQPFMGASDEEWAILKPRIERVQLLQRLAEGSGTGGNNGGNNQGNGNAGVPRPAISNPVQTIQKTLQNQFFDQRISETQLQSDLTSLRQAQSKARAELTASRKDLTELVTRRQEVLLVIMGILE